MISSKISCNASSTLACRRRRVIITSSTQRSVCKVHACSQESRSLPQRLIGEGMAASLAVALLVSSPLPAQASGLESVDLLSGLESIKPPESFKAGANKEAAKLKDVDDNFQNSDTLKRLLEQSAANKAKNKQAILDKYCYRQAEIGVGDCGGLRFIPGLTESGKQRTPDWLSDLLGVERAPPEDPDRLTMKKLFGGEIPR